MPVRKDDVGDRSATWKDTEIVRHPDKDGSCHSSRVKVHAAGGDDDLELAVTVELAEISGSETFLHVRNEQFVLVLHLPGVHEYAVDTPILIYIPTHKLFVFAADGQLVQAPSRRQGRAA